MTQRCLDLYSETPPCFSARLTARPGARPLCRRDGTYAPVQCHEETGYCWCVTPQGRALPDTSVRHKRPRCSKSSPRSASTRSGGERRRSHRQYNSNRHRNTCDRTEKSKFNGNLIENFKIEFRRTNISADGTTATRARNKTNKPDVKNVIALIVDRR